MRALSQSVDVAIQDYQRITFKPSLVLQTLTTWKSFCESLLNRFIFLITATECGDHTQDVHSSSGLTQVVNASIKGSYYKVSLFLNKVCQRQYNNLCYIISVSLAYGIMCQNY